MLSVGPGYVLKCVACVLSAADSQGVSMTQIGTWRVDLNSCACHFIKQKTLLHGYYGNG